MAETVRVIDSALDCPEIPIVDGEGNAKVVVWPGTGSNYRTFQLITLSDHAKTIPLRHPNDAAYYVVEGSGAVVDLATGEGQAMAEGAMVHIDAHDSYQFVASAGGFKILGGPCPADESLYAHLARG